MNKNRNSDFLGDHQYFWMSPRSANLYESNRFKQNAKYRRMCQGGSGSQGSL